MNSSDLLRNWYSLHCGTARMYCAMAGSQNSSVQICFRIITVGKYCLNFVSVQISDLAYAGFSSRSWLISELIRDAVVAFYTGNESWNLLWNFNCNGVGRQCFHDRLFLKENSKSSGLVIQIDQCSIWSGRAVCVFIAVLFAWVWKWILSQGNWCSSWFEPRCTGLVFT